MGWGKEWIDNEKWLGQQPIKAVIPWPEDWVTHTSDETPYTIFKKQGSNLVDAEAYLYFQCEGCSNILDPHTRSFKTLQDKRHEAGWKVVWNTNGLGYKIYCKKCGDGVRK